MTAYCMLSWLKASKEKLKLPPCRKDTVSLWFEVGWRRLLAYTNKSPESHPELKNLGKLPTSGKWVKRLTRRGLSEDTPNTLHHVRTARIKHIVKKSFFRQAGFDTK